MTTTEFWNSTENIFTKQRKITFDRYIFLNHKRFTGEPIETFWGFLRKLSLTCVSVTRI